MAAKPARAKSKAVAVAPDHQCTGASCAHCLQRRDAQRIQVGDVVLHRSTQRSGVVQRVEPRKGKMWLRVRITNTREEEESCDGYAEDFRRTGAVKVVNLKMKPPRDLSVYQVFRDIHGIAYLRMEMTKAGAKFVVNKGFSVELVELDGGTCRALGFHPVVGSSVWEAARRLLRPLNDQVTISMRAKAHLDSILQNKELENMATANTKATRTAKFATVTAPTAKGSKTSKAATKAPKKTKAAKGNGAAAGGGGGARLDGKIIKVKVKENTLREGTFCHAQVEALMKSDGKTVQHAQTKLDASGLNPNKRRIEIAWAVKKNFITIQDAK